MKNIFVALSAAAEQEPLIVELWRYFYDTYINPSEYYENLNLGGGSLLSVRVIIIGLCLGLAAASFGVVYNKRVLGSIVRKVLAAEALSPETAKTLEELGLENKAIARYAVRKSTSLRRVLKCREEQEFIAAQNAKREEFQQSSGNSGRKSKLKEIEYEINPYADVFYIPEEMKYMADVKFESKGTTWLGACVFSLLMVLVLVGLLVALPYILGLVNDLAGAFGTSPDNMI